MAGNIFNKIRVSRPKHSLFDMSYDVKLSLKMGELVPVHVQEVIPGDSFHVASEAMFRMMPMIAPIMHKVDIYFHNFFVPNRILWPNWEEFITGGEVAGITPGFPTITLVDGDADPSTLADYLGVPTPANNSPVTGISALPFAAYHRIWHEYYRDQNLQVSDPITLQNGNQTAPITAELLEIRKRAWEHDYFTSCLPFAQKGDAVELPLDLQGLDVQARQPGVGGQPEVRKSSDGSLIGGPFNLVTDAGSDFGHYDGATQVDSYYDPGDTLFVDGQQVTAGTTINDLRTAWSLQKWLEKNARAGSRYVESLLAHFGVRSSDKRMQRPEYLGGSKATMAISEVLQTSSSDVTTPQANMAGHGISVSTSKDHRFFCEEHGYFITVLSIRPKTAYYQGLPKHFSKLNRVDYYWPDFAFLGEQEVLNKEVFYDETDGDNNVTFGYIPRYSEYRYNPSKVHGQMRDTLEFWHMGRKFATRPALNESFVAADPTTRIFAVEDPDEDQIVAHVFHKILARRPIPQYGTPGGI